MYELFVADRTKMQPQARSLTTAVGTNMCAGRQVSIVTAAGGTPTAEDGSDVAAVLLTDAATGRSPACLAHLALMGDAGCWLLRPRAL